VIFFGGSMFQTNTQSESIKVTNVHSWVDSTGAANEIATTAFVVQNTGSKAVTISSINLRGLSVPTATMYYTITNNQTQLQTELPADFIEDSVTIAGVAITMDGGDGSTISLNQGDAAIVYLSEAGNITPIDSGNTYALQIQAGQATAVQQVSVVST
jgi:hypothetical protein